MFSEYFIRDIGENHPRSYFGFDLKLIYPNKVRASINREIGDLTRSEQIAIRLNRLLSD